MTESVISPKDSELLIEVRDTLALNEQPLCPDFYHLLDSLGLGYASQHPIHQCFENLLLDETDAILDAIKFNKSLPSTKLITVFDFFMSCIARRIHRVFNDPNQCRIALEALRRLSFNIMFKVLDNTENNLDENPVFSRVLQHQQFVTKYNALFKKTPNLSLCILAIQFDFGADDINTAHNILPEVIERLTNVIREKDAIVQISTRRWALCLDNVSDVNLATLAASKLRKQFASPFQTSKKINIVIPYIGIAISNSELNEAAALLQAALVASVMPASHPLGYQLYDAELDAEKKRLDILSIKLKKALFDNELELFYQPKYSISEKKIVGLEALLRWKLEDGYVHIPSIFTLIERDGLLEQFTTWLFQTSFRQLAEFIKCGMDIKMSVNILPQNLIQSEFSSLLSNMLSVWKVPRDRVIIEVTEGSMLADAEQTIEALQQIRDMGLKISMDDFGTGYSSLSYLSRLPINELKIDQAFVRNMFTSPRDEAIVRTIIEMGTNFELDFVAEGVETAKDAAHLSSMGCDIIQGYWISKPLNAKELIYWFNHDDKNQWKRLPLSINPL